ncbi:MAG: hypothetical protein AB7R69_00450 [Candidatus Babeliales bacterium]
MIKKIIFSTLVFTTMNAMDENSLFMQSYKKTLAAINAYQKVEPNQMNFLYAMKEDTKKIVLKDFLSCAELKNARAQTFTLAQYIHLKEAARGNALFNAQTTVILAGLYSYWSIFDINWDLNYDCFMDERYHWHRRWKVSQRSTDEKIEFFRDKVLWWGGILALAVIFRKHCRSEYLLNTEKVNNALSHVMSKKEAAKYNETLMRNMVDREKL